MAGADPEILKRGGALCRSPWLANEENFRLKTKITLQTISFWQNISINIFKSSPFLYTMKAYQLFKICKHFDLEREKTLTQHSTRKQN